MAIAESGNVEGRVAVVPNHTSEEVRHRAVNDPIGDVAVGHRS